MKTFQEFLEDNSNTVSEEAVTTDSMDGAVSDGTKKPKDKYMFKRTVKDEKSDEKN